MPLCLVFSACTNHSQTPTTTVAVAGVTAVATQLATPTSPPTTTAVTPEPTPSPAPLIEGELGLQVDNVNLYPSPDIYAGEKVTFQILADIPAGIDPNTVSVHVLVNYKDVANGYLNSSNLQGSAVGLFEWAWDTTDQAGEQLVHVILDRYDTIQIGDENPDNNQVSFSVSIKDSASLPPVEKNASWISRETDCCLVHVVRGTAAERDLPQLLTAVETAVAQASSRLGVQPNQKINIYLIDRVIGQGGYASYSIVASYLDRNYANNSFHHLITHEVTHILDRQFAPERITVLAEGLAVWVSDGHYKTENLDQRTAALVASNNYIPLTNLFNDFYPIQHEIGYLQAAGFVKFLIDKHGWHAFRNFYSDVTAQDGATIAEAVDINLQKHFHTTLADFEANWLAYLSQLPADPTAVADLETTIRYYNIMRRYQQLYDPTAYFLTAWLPFPEVLVQQGNPADLTRHPQNEVNVTLEIMLHAADTAVRAGDFTQANLLLDSISRVLENGGVFVVDPLANNYLRVVQAAIEFNYEPQQVALKANEAIVKATTSQDTELLALTIILSGNSWVLWR